MFTGFIQLNSFFFPVAMDLSKKAPVVVNVSNEALESNLKSLADEALKLYNGAIASIKGTFTMLPISVIIVIQI